MMKPTFLLRSLYAPLSCALALLVTAGCGGGSAVKTYRVIGKATYKGQPLSDAVVTFYPEKGRPAAATTDAQGTFSLSTFQANDGAPAGSYRVALAEPVQEIEMPLPGAPIPEPKPPRFPAHYTDPNHSGFTVEVKPGGENNFTFDLTE